MGTLFDRCGKNRRKYPILGNSEQGRFLRMSDSRENAGTFPDHGLLFTYEVPMYAAKPSYRPGTRNEGFTCGILQ